MEAPPEPCNSTPLAATRLAAYIYIYWAQPPTPSSIIISSFSLRVPAESSLLQGDICGKPKQGRVRLADPGSDGQCTKRSAANHRRDASCHSRGILCIPWILLFEAITKLTTHQLSLIAR